MTHLEFTNITFYTHVGTPIRTCLSETPIVSHWIVYNHASSGISPVMCTHKLNQLEPIRYIIFTRYYVHGPLAAI